MKSSPASSILVFHDNFAQMGGAERVAEHLVKALPSADLGTTLLVKERLSAYLCGLSISTTWMQYLPNKARLFRWYFLLYPIAVEGVETGPYELIVSSCFGYAKGIKKREGAIHICYCYTPMRWVWRTSDYLAREGMPSWKRGLLTFALKFLRSWELRAARRPDYFIAISQVVADRIKDCFGLDASVIAPPVETGRFSISNEIDNYYLVLSRLVPYKRIDLAIEACSRTGRNLKIIGGGPDLDRLRSLAGPTVEFLGRQSDEMVATIVSRCRGLIFPGEEDFGIAPLEANAAGRPVLAFAGGGALETVKDGLNGLLFKEATANSLIASLDTFESIHWQPEAIRKHALGYDSEVFQRRIREFIQAVAPHLSLMPSTRKLTKSRDTAERDERQ